ncbi:MAG: serine/threonine-protein kinase [Myxococcota bacterium]
MKDPGAERDLSGTVLERYRLTRRLGMGGMGAVYEAEHEMLDRRVAIKVLAARLAAHEIARKRFLREARAASRVKHDNVIDIQDVGFSGDHVFFVMERLEGRDLSELLDERKTLSWPEARPILLQVAAALSAAHAVGVVHRDIKPANCFLVGDDERVKVLDFGIAKVSSQGPNAVTELTTTGEVFGTAGYMPPETADGVSDDPRSDIYAMGVMMFRIFTGELPFNGNPLEVMAQHIGREPPAPRSMEPSIPQAVEAIILRCLEKQPDDRYPTMDALGDALEAVDGGAGRTEPAVPRPGRKPSRQGAAKIAKSQKQRAVESIERGKVIGLDDRTAPTPKTPPNPIGGWTDVHTRDVEPGLPPMPGEQDEPLELDLPKGRHPGDPGTDEPEFRAPPKPLPWRAIAAVAVVLGLGAAVWIYRDKLPRDVEGVEKAVGLEDGAPTSDADVVLLLIDTKPKDAKVYVDGKSRTERPIRVPRSEEFLRIRVEAPGYEPRKMQVQPLKTRRLEIELDRAGK